MNNYYKQNLNSQKLYQVYETKIPPIKQYLDAEIDFVKDSLSNTQRVLEIGAGYGRIMKELAPYCEFILGIDISKENVLFSKDYLKATKTLA
ncbi:hypothetical protein ACER0A_005785 [Haloimpatiens sp. FM7315]|uniref:hypothetical protein n=1 Tax=Haloimpatiens sp. FM7315 TaxID=3298609 RepID=UPI0035A389F9